MCGHYTLRNLRHPWLDEILPELEQPRYNIAPSQTILAVARDREGERKAGSAVWGFRDRKSTPGKSLEQIIPMP